jgi:chromosomal replication initiator protein
MPPQTGFAQLVALPENQSALAAAAELVLSLPEPLISPLFVYGQTGTGKTCLVSSVMQEAAAFTSCVLSANALPLPWDDDPPNAAERLDEARRCDLLAIEDLQHLPARATEVLVQLLDERSRRRLPTMVTATVGPAQLNQRGEPLPARLSNRLVGGLVITLQPLQPSSRHRCLREMANRRGLKLRDEIVTWLAEKLIGGRQIAGAIHEIDALQQLSRKPLALVDVRAHFAAPADAGRPTVERIVRRVSDYYHLEPRQLRSTRRQRGLLIARQVSMYLARRLTQLSLQEIGACFGGRDHTTVLHACRKVDRALKSDAKLRGAVQDMQAELA